MGFVSGTVSVGDEATLICDVPETGALIKNLGGPMIYLGNGGVGVKDETAGYPLAAGDSETFTGTKPPVPVTVPEPPPSAGGSPLYARTADGAGTALVAYIALG
jgi:hypothetical protein